MVSSRRTTLGGISTNRRVSLAAGLETNGNNITKPRSRGKQRMSMAPTLSSHSTLSSSSSAAAAAVKPTTPGRRKSLGGEALTRSAMSTIPPPERARVDPRPISEKAFFNSCVRKLHQYLESHEYESSTHAHAPIKLKDLTRPSSKDVRSVMTFLLRKIDPTFNDGRVKGRKFEDDVTAAFKNVGYPFNISKTALVAAGSPHTWPTLLLAITWLIELLELVEGVEDDTDDFIDRGFQPLETLGEAGQPLGSPEELQKRTDGAFMQYVENCYEFFLAGDDDYFDKQEVELLEYFEKDNIVILSEIEAVTDEFNTISAQVSEIHREAADDLPDSRQRLEDLATDVEKFHELVFQLNEHKATLAKKVEDSTIEVKKKEHALEKKKAKVNHLRSLVETQECSMDDIHKLEHEKANLEEKIQMTAKAKQEVEDGTLRTAMDVKNRLDELCAVVEVYNRQIEVSGAEESKKFQISIQKCSAHEADESMLLGGVDMRNDVLPNWNDEKRDLLDKAKQLRRDIMSLTDSKESSEQAVSEIQDEAELLVQEKRRVNDTQTREKEEQDRLLLSREKEVTEKNSLVQSLRDPNSLEASILEYDKQVLELEALRKERQDTNLSRKQMVLKEFNAFMQAYAEFQSYQEDQLKQLKEYKESLEDFTVSLSAKDQKLLLK